MKKYALLMFFIADHKPDDGFVLEYKEMTPHQTKLISVYGGYLRGYPCCRSLCTEKMSPQQNFFVNRASKYQNYCGKKSLVTATTVILVSTIHIVVVTNKIITTTTTLVR